MRNSRRKPKRAPKGPCVGPEYSDRRAVRNAAPLSLVAEPSMARCSGLLSRGGLRSCLGFAAVLAEQRGAARRAATAKRTWSSASENDICIVSS